MARFDRMNSDDGAEALFVDNAGNVYVTGWNGIPTDIDFATIKYSQSTSVMEDEWKIRHVDKNPFSISPRHILRKRLIPWPEEGSDLVLFVRKELKKSNSC